MSKIAHGFFSFTEITDPAEHRSYNEWHQLDHLPEQLTLDGIGWGERWVRSPACRAAGTASGPLDATDYVTLYLLSGPLDRTLAEFAELAVELRRAERFHQHRRAVVSGAFDVRAVAAAPRALVSAEAVPYRPNLGVHVRVDEVADPSAMGAHLAWLATEHVADLVTVPGVVGAWSFRQHTTGTDPGAITDHRVVTVAWLDADPLEVTTSIAALPPPPPGSTTVLAGPFEPIRPGEWSWFDGAATSTGSAREEAP